MKAVIMAGGKGTRLQSIAKDIPKPMFPVLGKPILEYQIESLKKSGIKEVTLVIGHLGESIKEHFGDGSKWGIEISYISEDKPLGTAGALFYLKDQIDDDFVLIFGDLILDVDWDRFMTFHNSKGGLITLYGHPNSHPFDSDVIVMDEDGKVKRIDPKGIERDHYHHNLVNAGIYCISPKLLDHITAPEKLDLEKGLIADEIEKGTVYTYRSTEYVKDMGTPDRLNAVTKDLERGIVSGRSLRNKQQAIFLDRDGTINVHKGFLNNVDGFELLEHVPEAVKKINMSRYLAIVATNQPVIARGECTYDELERIHMKMETDLGRQGAYIDAIYYCPHHPHKGYTGEVPKLKFDCTCRKPKIGMLLKAAERYNIDLSESWYIGDTTTDIQTGINAGMKTILVHTGEAGQDGRYPVKADHETDNLLGAVELILEGAAAGGQ